MPLPATALAPELTFPAEAGSGREHASVSVAVAALSVWPCRTSYRVSVLRARGPARNHNIHQGDNLCFIMMVRES
jgi:hypothetical protein